MDEIFNQIKIVPASRCLVHEGTVKKWVDDIASMIQRDKNLKNPIIVTAHKGHYVVLDGMHRFAAMAQLGIPDILVYEVDYNSPDIVLGGFDAFTFKKLNAENLMSELFPAAEGFHLQKFPTLSAAKEQVSSRDFLLAMSDKNGAVWGLDRTSGKEDMDAICEAVDRVDRVMSDRFPRAIYVNNELSLQDFGESAAASIVLRPQFSKGEVLDRTLNKKIFPPKSTRHLIPGRPLRVDVDLTLLSADLDLESKNRLLKKHLHWCFENNRVRYYPEPVYTFSD